MYDNNAFTKKNILNREIDFSINFRVEMFHN